MSRLAAKAAILGLWLPAAAHAAEERAPLVLEPSSEWVLDYAAERCTLVRHFGTGDDLVRLRIDSFGSWVEFRFTVAGGEVPGSRGPRGELKVRFTSDSEDRNTGSLRGKSDDDNAASFSAAFVPQLDFGSSAKLTLDQFLADPRITTFERQTDSLLLKFDRRNQIELRLGRMNAPLRAMRTCVDDLHKSWGLDPVSQRALTRAAQPTEDTVRAMQRRYPTPALLNGINAYVPVRVKVGVDGAATECVVQSDVVGNEFKRAVCQGLARPFRPALDAAGNPIASVYHTSVLYLIG